MSSFSKFKPITNNNEFQLWFKSDLCHKSEHLLNQHYFFNIYLCFESVYNP